MYTINRVRLNRILGVVLAAGTVGAAFGAGGGAGSMSLGEVGRDALHAALREETAWIRIHAAEVLVLEGDVAAVRALLAKEPVDGAGGFPRVGRWRLQARVEEGAARAAAIRRIEAVFLDPAGPPDTVQALESLCKLDAATSPEVIAKARTMAEQGAPRDRVFADWFLALAGVEGALDRVAGALDATDEIARLRAGYALRWLREGRRQVLARLAYAADNEPSASLARPYLIASAYQLRADIARVPIWKEALVGVVETGEPAARYEVAQVLMDDIAPAELAPWRPLLAQTGDNRIAAGWIFLRVGQRPAVPR